jgi:hypothetical protein
MTTQPKVLYQVTYDEDLKVMDVVRMDGGDVSELGYPLEAESITNIQVFEPIALVTMMRAGRAHCAVNRPRPRCVSC